MSGGVSDAVSPMNGAGKNEGGGTTSVGTKDQLPVMQNENRIFGFLKSLSWRSLACVTIYFLGYFNFSPAWIITPLLLSAARAQYKKEKKQRLAHAREAALTNEQATIESRMSVEDLPSWVFFPDKERAEWINNMLKQLWPYVNNYVRRTLFDSVEPMVKDILKGYNLKGFRFDKEHVHLGQIPPRITGIKVYNDKVTSRKEIIMDVDIVFASDLEVVFFLKLIKAKISELSVRGMMRIVFTPLVSEIPLIGGIQAYFLSVPEIDYNLGGVAGALEIPGLSKIVENIVLQQIRNFIVLPNKFVMPLVQTIPKQDLVCPNTAGVLRVTLIRAKELEQKDVGLGILKKGSSDPYAILTVGASTYKTSVISNNCNPVWDETYDFPVEVVHGQEFMMEFFDNDDGYDDEFLGRATVRTAAVADRGEINGFWVDLEECTTGKAQISLKWLPVTRNQSIVKEIAEASDNENTKCIVHIYIDSCSGLDDPKNSAYKPSPLVQLSSAKESRQTWPKSVTSAPVIEQGFVLLIKSPHSDDIHIRVLDTGKQNNCIGTASINVWDLIQQPGMEYPLQPWILKSSSRDAKIMLSVSVRGIKSAPNPTSKSPREQTPLIETPIRPGSQRKSSSTVQQSEMVRGMMDETVRPGTIRLVVHQAVELEKKDIGGKSDPYCIVQYENSKSETKVCKNTISPVWNHEETIKVQEHGDNTLYIKIMDRDKIGKDEPLGITSIDVRQVSKVGIMARVWDNLCDCKSGKVQYSAEFIPLHPSIPEEELKEETPAAKPPSDNLDTNTSQPPSYNSAVNNDDSVFLSPAASFRSGLSSVDSNPGMAETEQQDIQQTSSLPVRDVLEELSDQNTNENNLDQTADIDNKEADCINVDLVEDSEPPRDSVVGIQFDVNLEPEEDILPVTRTEGFLHMTVHRAIDLVAKDFNGKSDPYVVLYHGDNKAKSKTFKNDLNPNFEFTEIFYQPESGGPREVKVELWDKDIGDDEYLGSSIIDLACVLDQGEEYDNVWRDLDGVDSGKICFSVRFSQTKPASGDAVRRPSENNVISAAIGPALGIIGMPSNSGDGLRQRTSLIAPRGKIRITLLYDNTKEELKVFVHEAHGLPGGDLPDPPDPYVKIYLMPGKKKKKKTEVVVNSGSPRFDEEFDFDIDFSKVRNHSLKISIWDKKGVFAKSPSLGACHISLDNPGLSQGIADWYPLHNDEEDSD